MNNATTNLAERLAAIIAHLTAGNVDRSGELVNLLDTLDELSRQQITALVMAQGIDKDLRVINSSNEGAGSSRFKVYSVAEALLPQPPIDWIVKDLISPGTVTLFVGSPGTKKTYSLFDLAICVATGKPWLGFETKQTPVLLIDEESGKRRIDKRFGHIMHAHSADEQTNLSYITLEQINLRSSDERNEVETLIQKFKARLILIDALADVMPGADENTVKDVQPLMMNLRGIADKNKCAIIVIHHSNKQGDYRGSSALLGAVDNLIMAESKQGDSAIKFKMLKNRDGEPLEFYAVAHFEQDKFWLSSTSATPESIFSKSQVHVINHYILHGASSINDIKSNRGDFTEAAVKKANSLLMGSGHVKRIDGGGAGQKATYDLTKNGKDALKANVNL